MNSRVNRIVFQHFMALYGYVTLVISRMIIINPQAHTAKDVFNVPKEPAVILDKNMYHTNEQFEDGYPQDKVYQHTGNEVGICAELRQSYNSEEATHSFSSDLVFLFPHIKHRSIEFKLFTFFVIWHYATLLIT